VNVVIEMVKKNVLKLLGGGIWDGVVGRFRAQMGTN
jgi:hypothetical protein